MTRAVTRGVTGGVDPAAVPPLPGAIGVTHLRVYDSEAPDGLRGGTPHVHSVCTECYYVIAGRGVVQTLTLGGGFAETRLAPGALVWFTPGTIHRLVNRDGALEILVLMSDAGLPEAGDMVITLPADRLDDLDRYREVAVLPADEATTTGSGDAARHRRDLGVEGFSRLRDAVVAGDDRPLRAFHDRAARLLAPAAAGWGAVVAPGEELARRTRRHVDAVARADAAHLAAASVHRLDPPGDERRMGCCGTLGTYLPDGPPGRRP